MSVAIQDLTGGDYGTRRPGRRRTRFLSKVQGEQRPFRTRNDPNANETWGYISFRMHTGSESPIVLMPSIGGAWVQTDPTSRQPPELLRLLA